MKRPQLYGETHQQNQVRHRLHTSIQAAAYLADNPSDEVIDRELREIMNPSEPGTHPCPALKPAPAHACAPASWHRMLAFAALASVIAGAFVATLVVAPGNLAFLPVSVAAVGQLAAAGVRLLPLLRDDTSRSKLWLHLSAGHARRRTDEFTGS